MVYTYSILSGVVSCHMYVRYRVDCSLNYMIYILYERVITARMYNNNNNIDDKVYGVQTVIRSAGCRNRYLSV
jgi:hypothetical protein